MNPNHGIIEEAITFSKTITHERNIYKRMLMQNNAEIAMLENIGFPPKYVNWLKRIVKPITIFETLNLPFIVLGTTLKVLILRKKKRLARRIRG